MLCWLFSGSDSNPNKLELVFLSLLCSLQSLSPTASIIWFPLTVDFLLDLANGRHQQGSEGCKRERWRDFFYKVSPLWCSVWNTLSPISHWAPVRSFPSSAVAGLGGFHIPLFNPLNPTHPAANGPFINISEFEPPGCEFCFLTENDGELTR